MLKYFLVRIFLEKQFRTFVKKNADDIVVLEKNFSHYKLVDVDGSEITVDQLIDNYFTSPEDCFTKVYYDGDNDKEENCDNNSNREQGAENLSNDIPTTASMFTAATSNILYSSRIVRRQIQQQTQEEDFF